MSLFAEATQLLQSRFDNGQAGGVDDKHLKEYEQTIAQLKEEIQVS